MPKNLTETVSPEPARAGKKPIYDIKNSGAKDEAKILEAVNSLVQNGILIVLDAATSNCACDTCKTARKIAPSVKALITMGKVKTIKKVE